MEIFFYGLFMDLQTLSEKGIRAMHPRKGILNHYTLKIGERATLVPSGMDRAHGIVMSVENKDVQHLYSQASVADYVPEEVEIQLESGEYVKAICYNLPEERVSGANPEYALKLLELAERMAFPEDYLQEIKTA